MIWPGPTTSGPVAGTAGRVSSHPGRIISGISHERPSGWGRLRLRSQISVQRAPSPRCSTASAHGESPGRTVTVAPGAAARAPETPGTPEVADAADAPDASVPPGVGADLSAAGPGAVVSAVAVAGPVAAPTGRTGGAWSGPASGPSQPTVIATVATRWRARRCSGPNAVTRVASRPRASAATSAARQATNAAHATHRATVKAPMMAESDATVPGRSRTWSHEGTPVMGHSPQRSSANGTPTTRASRASAAPSPRSQRVSAMLAVGEVMGHAPG